MADCLLPNAGGAYGGLVLRVVTEADRRREAEEREAVRLALELQARVRREAEEAKEALRRDMVQAEQAAAALKLQMDMAQLSRDKELAEAEEAELRARQVSIIPACRAPVCPPTHQARAHTPGAHTHQARAHTRRAHTPGARTHTRRAHTACPTTHQARTHAR